MDSEQSIQVAPPTKKIPTLNVDAPTQKEVASSSFLQRVGSKLPLFLLVVSIIIQLGAHSLWRVTEADANPLSNHRNANERAFDLWMNKGRHVINYKGLAIAQASTWRNSTAVSKILQKMRVTDDGKKKKTMKTTTTATKPTIPTLTIYGDDNGRRVALALDRALSSNNQETMSSATSGQNDLLSDAHGLHLQYRWSPTANQLTSRLSSEGRTTLNEIIVLVVHSWNAASCAAEVASIENATETMRLGAPSLKIVWVLPLLPLRAQGQSELWRCRDQMLLRQQSYDEMLDGTRLTDQKGYEVQLSKDGQSYEIGVYDDLAQGLLNFLSKPPKRHVSTGDGVSSEDLKGISYDWKLGSLIVMVLTLLLTTFDNFLGLSWIGLKVVGLPSIEFDIVYSALAEKLEAAKLW